MKKKNRIDVKRIFVKKKKEQFLEIVKLICKLNVEILWIEKEVIKIEVPPRKKGRGEYTQRNNWLTFFFFTLRGFSYYFCLQLQVSKTKHVQKKKKISLLLF